MLRHHERQPSQRRRRRSSTRHSPSQRTRRGGARRRSALFAHGARTEIGKLGKQVGVCPDTDHESPISCCYPCLRNRPSEGWRRRPDLNRGWRFCRPLPYHLATAPFESCAGNRRPKSLQCARRLPSAFGPTTAQDATEERATTATAAHHFQAGRGAQNLVRSAFAPSGASADNLRLACQP